jgi:hypothetical protein
MFKDFDDEKPFANSSVHAEDEHGNKVDFDENEVASSLGEPIGKIISLLELNSAGVMHVDATSQTSDRAVMVVFTGIAAEKFGDVLGEVVEMVKLKLAELGQ